jgi:trehalose 6-phosphate phosphatase
MDDRLRAIETRVLSAGRAWLLLDYDGTLANFAPTPDDLLPDPQLQDLVSRLVAHPRLRVGVISGRRLAHIETLLPIPGLAIGGAYGLEFRLSDDRHVTRSRLADIRPSLDRLKPRIQALIAGRTGFYLEDKGWSLALHARFAPGEVADAVINTASGWMEQAAGDGLRVLGGERFVEIVPAAADKGSAIAWLLEQFPLPGGLSVFIGDDDKDERAFAVVNGLGGCSVVVSHSPRDSLAQACLANPSETRDWLEHLLQVLPAG